MPTLHSLSRGVNRFGGGLTDNLVMLWVPTSSSPLAVMRGHDSTVYAAIFSNVFVPNGEGSDRKQSVIVSAGMDQVVSSQCCSHLTLKQAFNLTN